LHSSQRAGAQRCSAGSAPEPSVAARYAARCAARCWCCAVAWLVAHARAARAPPPLPPLSAARARPFPMRLSPCAAPLPPACSRPRAVPPPRAVRVARAAGALQLASQRARARRSAPILAALRRPRAAAFQLVLRVRLRLPHATHASASSRCRTQAAADASCATRSSAASARAAASSAVCACASAALRRSHVMAPSSERSCSIDVESPNAL
jgi:hypothetical protein